MFKFGSSEVKINKWFSPRDEATDRYESHEYHVGHCIQAVDGNDQPLSEIITLSDRLPFSRARVSMASGWLALKTTFASKE